MITVDLAGKRARHRQRPGIARDVLRRIVAVTTWPATARGIAARQGRRPLASATFASAEPRAWSADRHAGTRHPDQCRAMPRISRPTIEENG
jgi:hypothetical protein